MDRPFKWIFGNYLVLYKNDSLGHLLPAGSRSDNNAYYNTSGNPALRDVSSSYHPASSHWHALVDYSLDIPTGQLVGMDSDLQLILQSTKPK